MSAAMPADITLEFALRQGDFRLEMAERAQARVLALFGASGSGKTTVLESIAGLRRPERGRIEVQGRTLYSSADGVNLAPRSRRIGYVPQDSVLFPHMNVRKNILYGAGRGNGITLARVLEILEIEPLLERRVASLSGGERQRVALARALMSSPRLILLDEPLAAVDLELRRRIVPCLRRIRDELGVPMVYVSHDAAEVRTIADRALVLDRGTVVASGDPAAVLGGY
jgi:molybdate transport system ATP-binding protein